MKIAADDLSKWYGQVIGINNLKFIIKPGVTGFLGPNGAGKTTLLRLLTGQLKPSKGAVSIDGFGIWNNYKILAKIGYCPEQNEFWDYLTGWQFVYSCLRMYNFSAEESKRRAHAAIDKMDMQETKNKKIGSYSKGMRQRIKMAQAIAHDPQILLFDEPLNGMDPIGRRTTIDLIKEYGEKGKTVIVSSHVLHEVEEMTDTILLINHGRLLAEGNMYEIRQLIDTHPLQVTIRCDKVNLLTLKLLEYDDVKSVQLNRRENQITIETQKPDEFHKRLPALALKNKIKIKSLWSPDENLEAVFDYLVR